MMRYKYILVWCLGILVHAFTAVGHIIPPMVKQVQVYDLRCQSLQRPIGIGESQPSFSWKLSSQKRSVKQFAYQITVASSQQKLETEPDMWDSGKMHSDKNTFILYHGKALKGASRYYWKVNVWVNDGEQSFKAQSSYFVTGLLDQQAWDNAKWIGYEALPDSMVVFPGVHGNGDNLGNKAKKRDVIPYFRKEFAVKKTVQQALAFVSGLGQYVLFMNGKRIDTSLLNPTWSDYYKRCYYNTYDVTAVLKQGPNVIGSIVGNGFLYINRERYRKLVIAAGYPMLRVKMIIRYTDGSTQEIVTDQSWKTAPSPITFSTVYGGEDFDANKIQKGWNLPGFADHAWRTPEIVTGPGGLMQAQEAYPVVKDGTFKPVILHPSPAKMRVYDFGQNVSGIVQLNASGPAGYRIRIIPSELLNDDHSFNQSASGSPYYWEYTLKGKGAERWEPLFSYYGFRYAAVQVFDAAGHQVEVNTVHIRSLLSQHTQYGAPEAGTFACSDSLFNQIFTLIRWGIRNNMSNVATDCPHREKLGWLEETHLMGNSIQYNYDILRYYDKITTDIIDAQQPNGLVPDIAPEYVVFDGGFRDSPEWGSAGILVPWYTYQWYGDKEVLRKSYDMMKKYVAFLGSKTKDNLLAYGLGDWFDLGPKPPGVSQLTPLGLTATAFYYYDAAILSKVSGILGDQVAMQRYESLAESIRQSFNQQFFHKDTHVYATGSQTSYAIPLYFGMVDSVDYPRVVSNLKDSIQANHYALTAGDIGFRYLIQALEQGQAYELIYRMNNRDDVPGYGYQLRKGATALTESWQALRNVSNDHMMLGHLMEWFYSGLAGIGQQEGSVGYKKILIKPQWVNEINWVHATYQSVHGRIAVNWKRDGGNHLRLQVEIPVNTTAKIVFPTDRPDQIREGKMLLSQTKSDGILNIVREADHTVIEVGSGEFDFSFLKTNQ